MFHSASDCKHTLSWQIQQDRPYMSVTQEVGNLIKGPDTCYVDIWLPDSRTGIESSLALNQKQGEMRI